MTPFSAQRFAVFRVALGTFLVVHFAMLLPHAPEIFGSAGMVSDPSLIPTYRIFPNLLVLMDSPLSTRLFIGSLTLLAVALTIGLWRPLVCVLLWYGWACLLNRNVLISNPGIAWVGWLLLATALVPGGEPFAVSGRPPADAEWQMPPVLYRGAWVLMAVGYTVSGLNKLGSPSWVDGSAFLYLLETPVARDTQLRVELMLLAPLVLRLITWTALGLEIVFAPLALFRRTRAVAWTAMVGMHLALLLVMNFADLTFGVLLVHLFTFDERWLPSQWPGLRAAWQRW